MRFEVDLGADIKKPQSRGFSFGVGRYFAAVSLFVEAGFF